MSSDKKANILYWIKICDLAAMYGKGWGKIFVVKNKRKKECKTFSIIQQRKYHCPLLVILSSIKIWITCSTATLLNITLAVVERNAMKGQCSIKWIMLLSTSVLFLTVHVTWIHFSYFISCLLRFLCAVFCSKHSPAISAQLDKSKRTLCTWKEIVHLTVRLF